VTVAAEMDRKLRAALQPTALEVHNESDQHSVPRGSETHFRVVVVSEVFAGKPLVARHKLVYEVLAAELSSGVHALTITSRTPEEWAASPASLVSPPCLGGSKAG